MSYRSPTACRALACRALACRALACIAIAQFLTLLLLPARGFAQKNPKAAEARLGRGQRWVRRHPLTTMALTIVAQTYDPQQYRDAGLTTTLAWKARTDLLQESVSGRLPWHLHLRPSELRKDGLTRALETRLTGYVAKYPGCTGWLVWDEPKRSEMAAAGKAIRWLKRAFPKTLVYSNAYPRGAKLERYYGGPLPADGYSYEQYLRDFATIMDPDVVMYDAYIFRESGSTGDPFPTLMTARKIGLETGKPYWTFVQSYADPRRGLRMPSESDLRMQVFAHLTAGYTGLGFFTYEDQQGPALVSNDTRERRPLYYHVARLNQEVQRLGGPLRFLKSTGVAYVAGSGRKPPGAVRAWRPGVGEPRLKDVTVDPRKRADWRDLLLGFFRDDRGATYLMVTNLWHDAKASAAERSVTVTLTFDPDVKFLGRLSRKSGQPQKLPVSEGRLQLTLPGGTGDLLRVGSNEFPGVKNSVKNGVQKNAARGNE